MPTDEDITKKLKTSLEAVEKLRSRRKEIKALLTKEGLTEPDEEKLAKELAAVCHAIAKIEENRLTLYSELG